MIHTIQRYGYRVRLTERDRKKLKPGEYFVFFPSEQGDRVVIRRRFTTSWEKLSDQVMPAVEVPVRLMQAGIKQLLGGGVGRMHSEINVISKDGHRERYSLSTEPDGQIRVKHFRRDKEYFVDRPYKGGQRISLAGEWTEFTGADVWEVINNRVNPGAYRSDWLLLLAKRAAAGRRDRAGKKRKRSLERLHK